MRSSLTALAVKLRRESGQVALETLLVFLPWLVVTLMFFNLVFFLGSAMLTQSVVNKAALQASAIGCLPNSLEDELARRSRGLGVGPRPGDSKVELIAASQQTSQSQRFPQFRRDDVVDQNGDLRAGTRVRNCSLASVDERVESGNYIYVQARYTQHMIFLQVPVTRSAVSISHAQEGENR